MLSLVPLIGAFALSPPLAGDQAREREVVLVARDMAFHTVSNDGVDSPVIRVAPGEKIRFVLQNEDTGIKHDLAVPDWDVRLGPVRAGGREAAVVRVPAQPGRVDYVCTLHGALMKGSIEIVSQ